jgi:catechol 2,3-dioxygenase-like lactoylglutathione lyase family enzyme
VLDERIGLESAFEKPCGSEVMFICRKRSPDPQYPWNKDNGSRSVPMLKESNVATRLPAKDLNRARNFYSEKLGLEPIEQRPGGLRYRSGDSFFVLFESAGEASGTHTQMGWEVDDIEATVAVLKARGVVFEEYDLPGLKTVDGIAEIAGNYPSKGLGERGSWFRDSEGNLLGIGQALSRLGDQLGNS